MYDMPFTHACTLIALSYAALKLKNRLFMERYETVSASLLTGLACIIMMLQPFPSDSPLTDLRFAPIVMAGLRFGPSVSLLSVLLPSCYIIGTGEAHGLVQIVLDLALPALVSSFFHRKDCNNGHAMIPFMDGIHVCLVLAAARLAVHGYMDFTFSVPLLFSHLMMLVVSSLAVVVLIMMYNDDNRTWMLQRRLELQANQDGLTGLPNLRSFMTIAGDTIRRHPISIMMIDIDNFKRYNDTFGHPQGDLLLREVGQLLRASINEKDYIARYGGEEFIIMSHSVDYGHLQSYAQQLCDTVAERCFGADNSQTTVSIGISVSLSCEDELLQIISEADEALYISKHSGKNRFSVYWPELFTAAAK
ncbi:diguanylate cyclase [Paenibacillus doosanensis]|uniref:Diguanylate cyclase YcdT n=1 Tax=Paenibacillus konkukensis TaxID=2020716 RepID=A0ABY4RLX6_9BACL|nr:MULTISPECIES: diguanylate cyclase [Paenibacillus]MCS7463525.1 diguanylate cyclase [Paenibacillus doosanensis]UQZ83391.1 putative diguanylate cyclase YcdT [Paenibacillus konkukensis]